MGQKSSIPEEVKKYKPCKCCRIALDHGTYRVYRYQAVRLESGKWSRSWGTLIGKIIPGEGFVPNRRYLREMKEAKQEALSLSEEFTDLSYGSYALLQSVSAPILENLKACYPQRQAAQIYACALLNCVCDSLSADQIHDTYQESVLSLVFKDQPISFHREEVASLLRDLGKRPDLARRLEELLSAESSKLLALKGQVLSPSVSGSFPVTGELPEEQICLLGAYDLTERNPLCYRSFRGPEIEPEAAAEFLQALSLQNCTFVMGEEYFRGDILNQLAAGNNSYVCEVPFTHPDFARIRETLTCDSHDEFLYSSPEGEETLIAYQEESFSGAARLTVFLNIDENGSCRKTYLTMLQKEAPGFSRQEYAQKCKEWGFLALQTNTALSVKELYTLYEKYREIPSQDFRPWELSLIDPLEEDYYLEHGLDLIRLVTGNVYASLQRAAAASCAEYSVSDLLFIAGHLRLTKEESGEWVLRNARKKDLDLLKRLGFEPQTLKQP